MKQSITSAILALSTFVAIATGGSAAQAGDYNKCSVTRLQYAQFPDGTNRLVFFACNYYWFAPMSGAGADMVRSFVNAAFLTGKSVNVTCGRNGNSCTGASAFVFDGTSAAPTSQYVWNVGGLQLNP